MTIVWTDNRSGIPSDLQARVDDLVRHHPVVADNRYTRWFARGEATADEVRHLTVQFSVFSHLFVEAQLRKVINAADLDTYRAGKEILMNELGVVFGRSGGGVGLGLGLWLGLGRGATGRPGRIGRIGRPPEQPRPSGP